MPRSINHEALLSPVLEIPTRYGVRPACDVLVRDLTGSAPIRIARYVQVYSTQPTPAEMRRRLQRALRTAYGANQVTTIASRPQWARTFRFVFDEGEPESLIGPAELPFIESADLC